MDTWTRVTASLFIISMTVSEKYDPFSPALKSALQKGLAKEVEEKDVEEAGMAS